MNIRTRAAVGIVMLASIVPLAVLPSRPQEPSSSPALPGVRPTPNGYVCFRASEPVTIDGKIDDAAWAAAPWTDDFVDIEGAAKPRPRFRTRVKMLWDDENLYIAAELEEPHVGALLTRHDSYIFHDDNDFEVFLDPDGDNHLYAELEMNALNTTWDLLLTKPYKDGGWAIDAWEIDRLRTAVRVDGTMNDPRDADRGWTIEIAWPWKGLAQIAACEVPPRDGDQWRINFSRVQLPRHFRDGRYRRIPDKPEENWVWSPQGAINMHMPERWGYLQFSSAPPGTVDYRPGPAELAKRALHRVYDAQNSYRKRYGRWARSLRQLGLPDLAGANFSNLRLEATSTYYEVGVDVRSNGGKTERWHIESDARVWKD
jgi:hypothetical protein